MKTIPMFAVCLTLALTGCGLQDGGTTPPPDDDTDAGTTPPSDGGGTPTDPTYLPAPFKSQAPYVLDYSIAYISGSLCGQLRGNLPGVSWSSGPNLADKDPMGNYDGYLGTAFIAPAGDYRTSYVDGPCAGETAMTGNWADYGNLKLQLPRIKAEDRAFIYCEQYVPADNKCVVVQSPGCNIRFHMDANGNVTPNGNMKDYDATTATGCF